MQLEYIEVDGWCQYKKSRRVEFVPGVNGILGPNGIGKSNILQAAFTALTGKVSGSKLEENINYEMDTAVIVLGFSVDGNPGRIRRRFSAPWTTEITAEGEEVRVRGSIKHTAQLEWNGEKITGITPVTERVTELTGLTPKIIETHVFISQDQLMSLLFQDKADRLRAFMQLHPDLERVAAIQKVIARELQLYPATVVAGDRAEKVNRVEALSSRISESTKSLQQLQEIVDDLRVKESEARLKLQKNEEAKAAALRLLELEDQKKSLVTSLADDNKQLEASILEEKRLADLVLRGKDEEEAARRTLAGLDSQKRLYASYMSLVARKERLAQESAALGGPPVRPHIPEDTAEGLEQRIAEVSAGLLSDKKQLALLDAGNATCPTCGSPIDSSPEKIDTLKASIVNMESAKDQAAGMLKSIRQMWQTYRSDAARYESEAKRVLSDTDAVNKELSETGVVTQPSEENFAAAREFLKSIEDMRIAHNNRRSDVMELQSRVTDKKNRISVIDQEVSRLQGSCQTARLSEADISECTAAIEQYAGESAELHSLTGSMAEMRNTLDAYKRDLDEYDAQVQQVAAVEAYRELLLAAKDALRQDKLPAVVLAATNKKLVGLCNAVMDHFDKPFAVDIDEEMGFQFIYPSGYSTNNPSRLSGGERCVLSVAMRFAINQLFANQVGVLALDEPTEYMDKQNRQLMGDLLKGTAAASRNAGLQTIIVTHADEITAFDKVERFA